MRWLRRATGVAVTVALCAGGLAVAFCTQRHAAGSASALLASDKPADRKLGAWLTADNGYAHTLDLIRRRLRFGLEPRADVREAYVYCLGRLGRPEDFTIVTNAAAADPSGYVRQAAWLAAARVDPDAFRVLAAGVDDSAELWDRLGVAIGELELGDFRHIGWVFEAAQTGSADHKLVACNALHRNVGPLLATVGRWPIGATRHHGQIWPPEFLAEIRRRCSELDLQRLASDCRPQMVAAKRLQRDARRLSSARNWVARLLSAL